MWGSTRGSERLSTAPTRRPEALKVERVSDLESRAGMAAGGRRCEGGSRLKAEQAARAELLALKETVGATDIEGWAMGLLRASAAAEAAGDSGRRGGDGPHRVASWRPAPGRLGGPRPGVLPGGPQRRGALPRRDAVRLSPATLVDPRYRAGRCWPTSATVVLVALVLTSLVVLLRALLRRRAYYFFYDFHFLFPRAAARWQTTAAGAVAAGVPVVFRLGVAPALLALFAASTLYLSIRERVVVVVLIGLLGLVPTAAAPLVVGAPPSPRPPPRTCTASSAAARASSRWCEQLRGAVAAEDKVGFAERSVLGRHHLRRGQVELAIAAPAAGARARAQTTWPPQRQPGGGASSPGRPRELPRHPRGRTKDRATRWPCSTSGASTSGAWRSTATASRPRWTRRTGPGRGARLDRLLPPLGTERRRRSSIGNELPAHAAAGDAELLRSRRPRAGARGGCTRQLTQMLLGDVPERVAHFYPCWRRCCCWASGLLARRCRRRGCATAAAGR